MKVTPKTEEEIRQGKLLVAGECDFQVKFAKDEISKSDNEMIHLTLMVWDSSGNNALVHDYLLEAIPHKIRHAAYACGIGHIYESGDISASDFLSKSGRVNIFHQEDKSGQYDTKNAVKDYVTAESTKKGDGYQAAKEAQQERKKMAAAGAGPAVPAEKSFDDKDIPF